MKSKISLIIITLTLFAFTGCLDMHLNLKIKPDGSGVIEEKIMMSNEIIQMLSSFSQMGDSTSADEGFNLFNPEELKEQAAQYGAGVKYVSGKEIIEDGRKGYIAQYSFANINNLNLDINPAGKASPTEMPTEESEKEDIKFAYKGGSTPELIIYMPKKELEDNVDIESEEENTPEDDSKPSEFDNPMVKQLLKDMKIYVTVEVDGKIVSTNATHVDGNKLTLMEMDFGKLFELPEKFEELKKAKPESITEMQEILKDIPGMRIEFQDKIKIKMK